MKNIAKKVLFAALLCVFTALSASAQLLNAASFNVRYDNESDRRAGDGWEKRCPRICDMVRFHGFDIFGTQETLYVQLNGLLSGLPGYGYIGVARDDGDRDGEFTAIFYDTGKLQLLESGNFWLSATPAEPSFGWDAACRRNCTWGRFAISDGGREFWFFNTHFDHVGTEARRESAKLILDKIGEIVPEGGTVILTGDFNVGPGDEALSLLDDSPLLGNAYGVAGVRMAWCGTFTGFDTSKPATEHIDHIFVSPPVTVFRYGILTDTYQDAAIASPDGCVVRYPSDHFPVLATLRL